jgi:hypothetical protein
MSTTEFNMKPNRKSILVLLIGFSLFVLIGIIACYILFFNPQRTFIITETYRITSESESETYLRVCLPVSGGYQVVSSPQVEGAESFSITTFDGWNELTALVSSQGVETQVTISYTVALMRNAPAWEASVLDEYCLPQEYVDSDNKAVIKQAEQLRGSNDYATARNTLDFVHKTIQAPRGNQVNNVQLTASELLDKPVGVCYDNAILMTALLRAEGIPARLISGLSLQIPLNKEGDWTHPGGAHAWVEFYVDGKWHFTDPTWGIFDRSDTAHLSYGTYDANITSAFQLARRQVIEEAGFQINADMSAPLAFTVYSTDEEVFVTPRAHVSFTWY